jgi:hypothetical protein
MVTIMSLLFVIEYGLVVTNMTYRTSPREYPEQFHNYPIDPARPDSLRIKYLFPIFFQFPVFADLNLAYLMGIGIQNGQLNNLLLDFLNLYLVSIYVLHFRNPLLSRSLEKVFWQFPTVTDSY